MFGFNNYNKSGRGVPKSAPRKKAFFRFFELFGRKFFLLLKLNLIYFLFTLPIITFGPSTAALCAVTRSLVLERPVFMFSDFLDAFKENFKKGLILGVADIILAGVFIFTITYYDLSVDMGSDGTDMIMLIMAICAAMLLLMAHFYIYLQLAATNLKLSGILKNSILMVFLGLKNNIVTLLVLIGVSALFFKFFGIAVFLLPVIPAAQICFLCGFSCYPVIQKYVINPYYEQNGLENPETLKKEQPSMFIDMGGQEQEINMTKFKSKGKIIK
ncbi:MAG: DUF624 domain-containing protein [Eubacterium sp.]|nr:DUF624 domain-containing protein [Eubacterium sp.]